MARIELFSERDLKGLSANIGTNIPDFTQISFNDRAKSIRITGSPWIVFEHVDYKGDFRLFRPGDYNSLPGFEDKISSVKMVKGNLDCPKMCVYEHIYYGGRGEVLWSDVANLESQGFKDLISSHKVVSGAWILYELPQYQGRRIVGVTGEEMSGYESLGWNNKVGSAQLVLTWQKMNEESNPPA